MNQSLFFTCSKIFVKKKILMLAGNFEIVASNTLFTCDNAILKVSINCLGKCDCKAHYYNFNGEKDFVFPFFNNHKNLCDTPKGSCKNHLKPHP